MVAHSYHYYPVTSKWIDPLIDLYNALKKEGYGKCFHPHPLTPSAARDIANYVGKDRYYIQVGNNSVLGYGMLRGWDAGHNVPSLGIAIHPSVHRKGLAKEFMKFLHEKASQMGATRIRLKVYDQNIPALRLYKLLGYSFHEKQDGQLIGYLDL